MNGNASEGPDYIHSTTCAAPEQATVAANLEGSKAWHIGQVALRFLIMLPPISTCEELAERALSIDERS